MKKILVSLLCVFLLAPNLSFAKKSKASEPEKIESTSDKKAERAAKKAAKKAERNARLSAKKAEAAAKKSSAKKGASYPDEKNTDILTKKATEAKKTSTAQSASKDSSSKKIYETFSVSHGIVKIQSVMENGAVLLFIEDDGNKQDSWIPVVEQRDLGESTYGSLFIDGIEYRLNTSGNVACAFESGSDFVTITYKVRDIAEVKANYVLSSRKPAGEANCILISYSILNRDRKKHDFALKVVYNTILGESRAAHFRTPANVAVSSEFSFQPSPENNWVITSDGRHALCFSLYGDEITPPSNVAMANKNVIEASRPEGVFVEGRPFTSVLAYNNSSLALFWEKFPVPMESEILYSYKINFSNADFQDDAELLKPYVPMAEFLPPPEIEEPQMPFEIAPQDGIPVSPSSPKEDAEQIDFETERNYLDPMKINPQYVQRLIDQINALEQTDPAVNREKIQELQAEINEVLEILRSRR